MNVRSIIPFDYHVAGKVLKDNFYNGMFIGKPVQAVCYDSKRGDFVVGFSNNSDGKKSTLIRIKQLEFNDYDVEIVKDNIILGHCNDMVYNPKNDRIYVAVGNWKQIAVVYADSLNVEKMIDLDFYPWAIAMYKNGDFYVNDNNGGRRYDPNFRSYKVVSTGDTEKIAAALHVPYDEEKKCYRGYWQGALVINDKPYMIYTEWSDEKWVFKSCVLATFYPDGGMDLYRCETPYETESVCQVGNHLEFVFGNVWIGGAVWYMSEMYNRQFVGTVKNVKIEANNNKDIDCTGFIPEDYDMTAACVNFKTKTWRALPYVDSDGKVVARILRVDKKKIVIRSSEAFENVTLQITAFGKYTG